MSAALASLAVVAALGASKPAAWSLSVASEVRGDGSDSVMQVSPSGQLLFAAGAAALSLDYSPRLLSHLPFGLAHSDVQHRASANLQLRLSRRVQLFASQQASFGTVDFSPLAQGNGSTAPVLDQLVQLPTLAYQSLATAAGLSATLPRGLRASATASYGISGGADAFARSLLPVSHLARGAASFGLPLDRRDDLDLGVSAAVFTLNRDRSTMLDAWAALRRKLLRGLAGDVSVGASTPAGRGGRTSATASAGLGWQPASLPRLGLSLRMRYAPAFDPIAGTVYSRAEASGSGSFALHRAVSLFASASAALARTAPQPGQLLGFAAAGASWAATPEMSFGGGVRGAWLPAATAGFFVSWTLAARSSP